MSLFIEKGEFVCIIGSSGSGKTSLLNIIGTLSLPTEGKVWINGASITDIQWFRVLGYDIEVKKILIAEALQVLSEKKRDVILLSTMKSLGGILRLKKVKRRRRRRLLKRRRK